MTNVTVVSYDLPNAGTSRPAAAALQRQVIERLAAMPGVRAVAESSAMPLSIQHTETRFGFAGTEATRYFEFSSGHADYFDVLHIPIVRGRNFTPAEVESEAAVIVTESTARRLWPGVDPLGQVLTLDKVDRPVVGIVQGRPGVAARARPTAPTCSCRRAPTSQVRVQLLVAGAAAAPRRAPIRGIVAALDPQLAVEVTRLEDNLEQWRAPSKLVAALSSTLAILALVLACTGVFGTVAYTVSRRVREIGIRVALGAAHEDVLRLIVRQGMRPVVIGMAIGLAGAAAVSTPARDDAVRAEPVRPVVVPAGAGGALPDRARRLLRPGPPGAPRRTDHRAAHRVRRTAGSAGRGRRGCAIDVHVHVKKYTVSMVRERLSEALDEAQRGEPVFIQRQGVEYRLTVEPARSRRKKAVAPRIEIVDPALSAGQWTWDSTAGGQLKFRSRRRS